MTYLYILMAIGAGMLFCYWLFETRSKKSYYATIAFYCALAVFAAFRPLNLDRDYRSYVDLFFRENAFDYIEPTFRAMCYVIHEYLGSHVQYLFMSYAFIGMFFKLSATLKTSVDPLGTLLVFFSNYYIYHDLTQIRASVGTILFFTAMYLVVHRRVMVGLAVYILAVLFHYSLLIGAPMLLLNPTRMRRRVYIGAIVAAYVAAALGVGFDTILETLQIKFRFLEYKIGVNASSVASAEVEPVKLFNWMQLSKIALALVLMWRLPETQRISPYAIILLKLYVMSIIAFVLLSSNGLYAFRISQIFGYSEVFLLPIAAMLLPNRLIGKLAVCGYAVCMLAYNLWYVELLTFNKQ